jgi:hypothetical protein
MLDTDSAEFKDLLAAWLHALKVLDTKLQAHILAVTELQNSEFHAAAPSLRLRVERAPLDTTAEKHGPIAEPFPGPAKWTVMVRTRFARFGPKNPSL